MRPSLLTCKSALTFSLNASYIVKGISLLLLGGRRCLAEKVQKCTLTLVEVLGCKSLVQTSAAQL